MIEALTYIGLSQSLFAAFVIGTKKQKQVHDWVLFSWLLIIALKFLILIVANKHVDYFDVEFSIGLIPLTFGPCLFLYTKYLTDDTRKFRKRNLIHFFPFIFLTLCYFVFFKEKISFDDARFFIKDDYRWARILYALAFVFSIFLYTSITFYKLMLYRRNIKNQFSVETENNRLGWLSFVAILYTVTFITYMSIGGINAFSGFKAVQAETVTSIGLTAIAFSVSYFGMRQPSLFSKKYETVFEEITHIEEKEEDVLPVHKSDEMADVAAKLALFMQEEKPYLNPELTIQDLADKAAIPKNTLTQVFNLYVGKNFFTYINEYRVEEVKRRMKDTRYEHLSLLAIGLDSGFNSKSSFNSLFKQYTGKTPSEFKKEG